jgi:hypothetical protein
MKNLVLALGLVMTTAFAVTPSSAFQASDLLDATATQSTIEQVQRCGRGMYWCPGRISGCCRVGWACGSRVCYRSKTRTSAAAKRNKVPASSN